MEGIYSFEFPRLRKVKGVWEAEIRSLAGVFPKQDRVAGLGRVTGGVEVEDHWHRTILTLGLSPLRFRDHPTLRFTGEIEFLRGLTLLKDFDLQSERGRIRMDARLPYEESEEELKLDAMWSDFDFGWIGDTIARRYPFLLGMQGRSNGSIDLAGHAGAAVREAGGDGLPAQVEGGNFERLSGRLLFSGGNATLEDVALVMDGKIARRVGHLRHGGIQGLQGLGGRSSRFPLFRTGIRPEHLYASLRLDGV